MAYCAVIAILDRSVGLDIGNGLIVSVSDPLGESRNDAAKKQSKND